MQKDSPKRVDAYLSSLGYCSRKESKKFLKIHDVYINNEKVTNPSTKALHREITINGEPLDPQSITIVMNKPSGVICSHNDSGVLIYSLLPERWQRRNPKLSTIGRLDMDTTGAIIITDDGALNSKLCSPKSKATKLYEATLAQPIKGNEKEIFASGELLLNSETKPLLPAKFIAISPTLVQLEICEGRYHQVKRMFAAVGNKVVKLHRISFAGIRVDDIKEGKYKEISFCFDNIP